MRPIHARGTFRATALGVAATAAAALCFAHSGSETGHAKNLALAGAEGTIQHLHIDIPEIPLEGYVRLADDFIYGTVVASRAELNRFHYPCTVYTVQVAASATGLFETEIEVGVIGASTAENTMVVDEAPVFQPGDSIAAFVEETDGSLGILGLNQGNYSVIEDHWSGPKLTGLHAPEGTSLAEFFDRIHVAIAAIPAKGE